MTTSYCLEIGCEEIPSRFIEELCLNLKLKFIEALGRNRLVCDENSVQTYATYRRLLVMVPQLADKQLDESLYIKGPPVHIGLDKDGNFSQAALGFAKKFSVTEKDLCVREFDGNEHVSYLKETVGLDTIAVLTTLVPAVIKSLPLSINMRWGSHPESFIRPIHWIVSLYGKTVVPFSLFGIQAGAISYAHRMLSEGKNSLGKPVTIKSATSLQEKLKNHSVMLNQADRKAVIEEALQDHDQSDIDSKLVNEVVYLTEQPVVLKGTFDAKYLELPDFVLIECMKKHQRYFPVIQKGKGLIPAFLFVADNVTAGNEETIIKGNQKVLAARLEDALFFYKQDTSVMFESFVERLKGVVFQKNCGTMYDKQERLAKILIFLRNQVGVNDGEDDFLNRLAYLSKADLVTQVVVEFPSLQGKMGAHYASLTDDNKVYGNDIAEQYLPTGFSSDLPESIPGALLALADRFDTVVYSFFNGAKPTGSQDPLGLRRAVNGIFRILHKFDWHCDINAVCDYCYSLIGAEKHRDRLDGFIQGRFHGMLLDDGFSHDMADSIAHLAVTNISLAIEKGEAINQFKEKDFNGFKLISETAVRVHRLAVKADSMVVKDTLFEHEIEKRLYHCVDSKKDQFFNGHVFNGTDRLVDLVSISQDFTRYFDEVLVMVDDDEVRNNRLRFLAFCDTLFLQFADFEKIVIAQ